ncbi:MAG TPA: hypothetical protein VFW07_22855 [Parafilimonas sp.]|nr:hypothetical protein [Parafilimonas sp.]
MQYSKYVVHLLLLFLAFNKTQAQVPVVKEPRHKIVVENNYIRLIDVHLSPRDTTLYHIHATPSVIVFISRSEMGTQDMSGKGIPPGETLPGQTLFRDYAKEPVTHRVYNSGDNIFHVMDIELVKKDPSPDSCNFLQQSNGETTINERLVRVYKFDLNAHQSFSIPKGNCAYLLICISGKINAADKNIPEGSYIFFDPGSSVYIRNGINNLSTCILVELK